MLIVLCLTSIAEVVNISILQYLSSWFDIPPVHVCNIITLNIHQNLNEYCDAEFIFMPSMTSVSLPYFCGK